MQERIDKLSYRSWSARTAIVQREIASPGWVEARSVECEYVIRDSRRDDSTWLGLHRWRAALRAPGPQREL